MKNSHPKDTLMDEKELCLINNAQLKQMYKKPIPISKILVNTENPRFEPVNGQQAALDLMLEKAGKAVLNLAKDIAQHGLNPSKRLMVIEQKDGNFLPLEGNRRIVALKLLHNPDEATDKNFANKFKEFKKEFGAQLPNEVECVVFPDKESAFRWVNLEHTGRNKGVGVLSWDSTQRQRFIVQYADENNLNHDKVDATTLDRLTGTPFVREQIGINFPDGLLDLAKSKGHVLKNLRKIFAAMSDKDFKVGDIYTSTKSKSWIKDVLGVVEKEKSGVEQKPIDAKAKKDIFDGDWITHQLYSVYPKQNRVKAILKELKDINPKQKPNICGTALRVLLELAVYVFLKDNGKIKSIIDLERARVANENKKRRGKRALDKDWSPSFQRTLHYISSNEDIMTDPLERKTLKTFIGKKSNEPFLTELNQFTHNPDYEPGPDAITEIWNKLGKLIFRTILFKQDENNK